ncbi:Plant organelle RNA recognition domain [Quillaja saponaria]|uniref:Plant organelle RNA recognition domain n=1 Tax=Quillaja saponaria TaxID=32244 RepID=A0AAD7Q790_QUISA|nr:Plant organelle RNA recognition domain [Quillaja saponaria]
MACAMKQFLYPTRENSHSQLSSTMLIAISSCNYQRFSRLRYSNLSTAARAAKKTVVKASAGNDGGADDGVSLGTMKLPPDTDIQRFESLLFQWANSLCQGANLPLPVPLKVDRVSGGARLGFITIGDGETEVLVYIDCLVFPATSNSGPVFRAIRNGHLKDKSPPGEPRIMRSLLQALKKSVEIARI